MSSVENKEKENETISTEKEKISKEIIFPDNDNGKEEDEQDTSLQQEKKRYINFYFFQISIGIIFAYLYIIISILMNVINRIIFHTYHFKFNFTILFFQQLFCIITFILLSMYSKTYRDKVGEISFYDFQTLQKSYISFSCIFFFLLKQNKDFSLLIIIAPKNLS